MPLDLTRFHPVFFDETAEYLSTMELLLLHLDPRDPDAALLEDIGRAAHSIKGAGGTVGFRDMARLAGEVSALVAGVRQGRRPLNAELLQALLGQHAGHHLGVGDRAVLRHDAVDADRDEAAGRGEHRGAERSAGAVLDVAACELDRERDLGRIVLVQALLVDMLAQPQRQGEVELGEDHRVLTCRQP